MDLSNLNNNFLGIKRIMNLFAERMEPYAEKLRIAEQNATLLLEDFAEKAKPFRAFQILAENQFTYWKPLCNIDVEGILTCSDVDKYLSERIEDITFIDYEKICADIVHSVLLSETNKSILNQTIHAMDFGLYDLALVGTVTVFDGVLSVATNDTATSIVKRLNAIRKRIETYTDEEWELLHESDITTFGMYITWTKSMMEFQKYSEFEKPETEPQDLNRHWISHGRKTSGATKLDCCKMLNALYGLIYFGDAL